MHADRRKRPAKVDDALRRAGSLTDLRLLVLYGDNIKASQRRSACHYGAVASDQVDLIGFGSFHFLMLVFDKADLPIARNVCV